MGLRNGHFRGCAPEQGRTRRGSRIVAECAGRFGHGRGVRGLEVAESRGGEE
jgi:hypothetical protein